MTLPQRYIAEAFLIETPDGQRLPLQGDVYATGFDGFGAPGVEFETRKGYRQNGNSVIGYQLDARQITLQLRGTTAQTRDDFWELRQRITDIIRPNRGTDDGQFTLYVIRSDNKRFSIDVRYTGGLSLPLNDESNDFGFSTTLNLEAANPLWRGAAHTETGDDVTSEHLVFPITFGIQFGEEGIQRLTPVLPYDGTWLEYPTITVTGGYISLTLNNKATGAAIQMQTPINDGDQRILTLSDDNFSIVDANGVSRIDELSANSNLVDFYLPPDSDLGDNERRIEAVFLGGNNATNALTVTYNERYFAL